MKDGFLDARGIAYRTNAFVEGRPTLVFIHGLSGSSSAWKKYEDELKDSYNIVTYDLRGHALSKRYGAYSDYELQKFADDLHQLLEYLKITECVLISHSLGTLIALNYLHYYPTITTKALFLAPTYKQNEITSVRFEVPLLSVAAGFFSLFPFYPKGGRRIDYSAFTYSPDISLKRIVPEIKDMTVRLYLYCLRQLYVFNNHTWWKEIVVPVTIMHGTKDSFVPYKQSVLLQKEIAGSTLITLPSANHMLVINNRKEIIDTIKSM